MKKYVIIKTHSDSGDVMWRSHKYGFMFKVLGKNHPNWISISFNDAEDCESRLRKALDGKNKPIEIIKILEI